MTIYPLDHDSPSDANDGRHRYEVYVAGQLSGCVDTLDEAADVVAIADDPADVRITDTRWRETGRPGGRLGRIYHVHLETRR